jgi:hypothetical protein
LNATEQSPKFAPGFRLSLYDVVVLIVGIGSAVALSQTYLTSSLIIAFVVGHFFLFCNVFRISRTPELIWASVFLLLAGGTLIANIPGWIATISISLAVTIVAIALEMKKPSYHGVGWRTINPNLKDWWDSQIASRSR